MDNIINSVVSKTIGLTDRQVIDKLSANPNMNDAEIVDFMQANGVTPTQMASIAQVPVGQVIARVAATVPPGQTVTLGDTIVQPQYQTIGSGQDQQIGGLENVLTYKTSENQVGGGYNQYNPDGTLQRQGTQQKVDNSLLPFVLAAGGMMLGLPGLGEAGAGTTFAGEALADAGLLSGGGGSTLGSLGALGATDYGLGTNVVGMGTGTGITSGYSGLGLNAGTAGLGADGLGAGITAGSGLTGTGVLSGSGLGTSLLGTGTGTGLGTGVLTGSGLGTSLLGTGTGTGLSTGLGTGLGTSLGTGLGLSALGTGLGAVANQQGITDARNLINQYGTQASTSLADAYRNAQNLNAANRTDLGNVYQNLNTNLNNTLNAQAGIYGQTNANLANNYSNTLGNMQSLYNQQVGYQDPYQDIGRAGSQGLLANQDYLTHQFNANDLNANLAPNYAFQLQQGQMANQRAGNAAGGALGGNALQGLQRYTQDYAGGAYQQAFNNYNAQRNNIYNSLAGMANIGTTSAGQLANIGNTYGSNMGSLSSTYGGNMLSNAGQLQGAYNQYGSNLTGAANTYGGNLTTAAGQGINAANAYGLNTANLATGIGSALASNATQSGANNAALLSNLGNTALLGSMLKAT
jgi:hypothetical protein